jgi:hypothetical protein
MLLGVGLAAASASEALTLLLATPGLRGRLAGGLAGLPSPLGPAADRAFARVRDVPLGGAVVARLLAWSLAAHLANAATCLLLLRALEVEAPAGLVLVTYALSSLAVLVPVSLGGLGVREMAWAAVFARAGADPAAAVALSVLWVAVNAAWSLAGGVVFAVGRARGGAVVDGPSPDASEPLCRGDFASEGRPGRRGKPAAGVAREGTQPRAGE